VRQAVLDRPRIAPDRLLQYTREAVAEKGEKKLPVDWVALAVAFALVAAVKLGLFTRVPW
jgi:hypothetical protein